MAYWDNQLGYICGEKNHKSGTPCIKRAIVRMDWESKDWKCEKHLGYKDIMQEGEFGMVPVAEARQQYGAGYSGLLPDRLVVHYSDEDPQLLQLKHRVALLETLLRNKVANLDAEGSATHWNKANKIVQRMKNMPMVPEVEEAFKDLVGVIERADSQTFLESDIRNLVQEICAAVKQETSQMQMLGQFFTLQQVAIMVERLHKLAVNSLPDDRTKELFNAEWRDAIEVSALVEKSP